MSPESPSTLRTWTGLFALVCAGLMIATFIFMTIERPLHADEAVQWSLMREAHEGHPYSANQDRFHGPALAVLTQVIVFFTHADVLDLGPVYLRAIPFCFALSLVALPWFLPGVGRRAAMISSVALLLASGFGRYAGYYVQEALLASAFTWGAVWWMRGVAEERRDFLAASGAAFGFALACKVTALAYFCCFALAVLTCHHRELRRRHFTVFAPSLVGSWVLLQTSLLSDWEGLGAWGRQLVRSFRVATGHDEGTLLIDSPWPWLAALLLWTAFAIVRWGAGFPGRKLGTQRGDVVFVCASLILALHLHLPYKTPWLLLTPTVLLVALVLPLGFEGADFRRFGVWVYAMLLVGYGLDRPFTNPGHTATAPEVVRFAEEVDRMEQAYGAGRFYIAIEGGHYWPLPYYLRKQKVGYGPFDGSERAPLRLLPATDASRPAVPGYQAFRLPVRKGEFYWVLVAKGYENHFTALRGP